MDMLGAMGRSAMRSGSIVARSATQAGAAAVDNVSSRACERCNETKTGFRLSTCPVCDKKICGSCSVKVVVPAPCAKSGHACERPSCREACAPTCVEVARTQFRAALTASTAASVDAFLGGSEEDLFERPDRPIVDVSATASARRLLPLALKAVELAGYSEVIYAYKLAEGGIVAALLTPTFRVFVERVLPMLSKHIERAGAEMDAKKAGAKEAELALRLYYLACGEAVKRLCDPPEEISHGAPASTEALDSLGTMIGPAQWLYAAHELRAPQATAAWGAWYVGRLAKASGWRLVACVGASRSEDFRLAVPGLPPTRFPAWCLVCRGEEAVLAFRGSTSPQDWAINSECDEVQICHENAPQDWSAHGGMVRAARAVLYDCGAAAAVAKLRKAGLKVKCVGHSLGAGVAALATALLNLDDSTKPLVTASLYAVPACASPALAEALKATVEAAILRDDVVPRLSEKHCARLAREVVADDAHYREAFAKDRAAYARYCNTLGKKEGMVHDDGPSSEPPTPPPKAEPPKAIRLLADDDVRPLVPPGRLVFCQGRDGVFEAQRGDHTLEPLQTVQVTPRAVDDHSLDAIAFALRAVRARRGAAPGVTPAPLKPARTDGAWAPCAVCGSDVTWTSSVRGSDTARAYSTHHCRACGEVVCAFCAPAADSVAADALGETLTLPDKRVTLPSRGCLGPVRVCRPCAYVSYDM